VESLLSLVGSKRLRRGLLARVWDSLNHLIHYRELINPLERVLFEALLLFAGHSTLLQVSIVTSLRRLWVVLISLLHAKGHPNALRVIHYKEAMRHKPSRRPNYLIIDFLIEHTILHWVHFNRWDNIPHPRRRAETRTLPLVGVLLECVPRVLSRSALVKRRVLFPIRRLSPNFR